MQTIDTEKIPHGYATCLHANCPLSAMCLRSLAYESQLAAAPRLTILNPTQCTPAADCPNFSSATPVRFARGLRNVKARMFPGQYAQFRKELCKRYGTSGFYRRLKGDMLLGQADQSEIAELMKEAGADAEPQFDSYEIGYNW